MPNTDESHPKPLFLDPKRFFLELSSATSTTRRVPPHQPTRISARPAKGAFVLSDLIIAGEQEHTKNIWIVNAIEVNGKTQRLPKDLPGGLFGGPSARVSFYGLDPVEHDQELTIVVTYIGANPEGMPFFASAWGSRPSQRPTMVPIAAGRLLLPTEHTTISVLPQNAPFKIERLCILATDTRGEGADWIVNNLLVDGRTQFKQSGDIPGDLFATNVVDTFVTLETCPAGSPIELVVSYIGINKEGALFTARLEGTVPRPDYTIAPPDLHVLIRESGQALRSVIGTCNWRPPAIDDGKARA